MVDLIQVLSNINGCSTAIDCCQTKLSFANPSHPAYLVTEIVEYFPSVLVDDVQTQVEIWILAFKTKEFPSLEDNTSFFLY